MTRTSASGIDGSSLKSGVALCVGSKEVVGLVISRTRKVISPVDACLQSSQRVHLEDRVVG